MILSGRLDEGRRWIAEGNRLVERLGHPFSTCIGTQQIAVAHELLGEFDAAFANGTECLERATDRKFVMPIEFGQLLVGASIIELGERERGIGLMAGVFAKPAIAVPASWRAAHLAWLASAEIDDGDELAAAAHLEQGRTIVLELGGSFAAAEIDRIEAKLARSRGATWETADAHLERAIVTSRTDGTPILELRALADRLTLFRDAGAGDESKACDDLRAVLASIDGDSSYVRHARELLETHAVVSDR